MGMTQAELEYEAHNRHQCPRCHAPKMNPCRDVEPGADRSVNMDHPHPERVKLITDPAAPVPGCGRLPIGTDLNLLVDAVRYAARSKVRFVTANLIQRNVRVGFVTANRLLALLIQEAIIDPERDTRGRHRTTITPGVLDIVLARLRHIAREELGEPAPVHMTGTIRPFAVCGSFDVREPQTRNAGEVTCLDCVVLVPELLAAYDGYMHAYHGDIPVEGCDRSTHTGPAYEAGFQRGLTRRDREHAKENL